MELGQALIDIIIELVGGQQALREATNFFDALDEQIKGVGASTSEFKNMFRDLTSGLDIKSLNNLKDLETGLENAGNSAKTAAKQIDEAAEAVDNLSKAEKRRKDAEDSRGLVNRTVLGERERQGRENARQELSDSGPDLFDQIDRTIADDNRRRNSSADLIEEVNKERIKAEKEANTKAENSAREQQRLAKLNLASTNKQQTAADKTLSAQQKASDLSLRASDSQFAASQAGQAAAVAADQHQQSTIAAATASQTAADSLQKASAEQLKANTLQEAATKAAASGNEQQAVAASRAAFIQQDAASRAANDAAVSTAEAFKQADIVEQTAKTRAESSKIAATAAKEFSDQQTKAAKAASDAVVIARKEVDNARLSPPTKAAAENLTNAEKRLEVAEQLESTNLRAAVLAETEANTRRDTATKDAAIAKTAAKDRAKASKTASDADKDADKAVNRSIKSHKDLNNAIEVENRLARRGLNLADRSNKFAEQRTEEQKALNAALKKGLISQEQFEAADRASLKRQQRGPRLSGKALLQSGSEISSFGREVGFAGALILGAFTAPVVAFAKFEQSTRNVIAVLGDLETAGQQAASFEVLSETFLRLGERTEFTANQIADAARQLALAGFTSSEIVDSIDAVTQLASAGNIGLERAAQISANVGKAFGIDPSNFQRVADVLAEVASNSNTTVETLGESLKLAGPIAANLGQQVEEVTAVIGVLGNAGLTGTLAGTGIARAFSQMVEKADEFDELLQKVGSSFDAINPEKVGLREAVREFERLSNIGALDTSDFFSSLDQRAARSIVTLINQGSDAVDELFEKAENSAGRAAQIRDQRLDTLQGSATIALSALTTSLIELGELTGEALKPIIEGFTESTNSFNRFVSENEGGFSSLITIAGVLGGSLLGLSGVIQTVGFVTRSLGLARIFGEATDETNRLVLALRRAVVASKAFVFTPFGGIVTALVAVGAAAAAIAIHMSEVNRKAKFVTRLNANLAQTEEVLDKSFGVLAKLNKELDLLKAFPSATDLEINLLVNGKFPSSGDISNEVDKLQKEVYALTSPDRLKDIFDNNFNSIGSSGFSGVVGQLLQAVGGGDSIISNFREELNKVTGELDIVGDRTSVAGKIREEGAFRVSAKDLDEDSQKALVNIRELQLRLEDLRKAQDSRNFLSNAFAGGETGLADASRQITSEIESEQEKLAKLETKLRAASGQNDKRSVDSLNKQITLTKGIIAQKGKLQDVVEAALSKTEEQIAADAKINQLLIERDRLRSNNAPQASIDAVNNRLDIRRKNLQDINKLIEETTELQKENRKAADKRQKEVDALDKERAERGLTDAEKKIRELEAKRDAVLADLQSRTPEGEIDNVSQIGQANQKIRNAEKVVNAGEDLVRRDRSGDLPFKDEDERNTTEANLEKNRASLAKFQKERDELKKRLTNQIATLNAEIDDLTKKEQENKAKDAKKEQDQIEKTRRSLEKASNERLLDLAKRSKNLKEILALTEALGKAQIAADTESFVKQEDADKSPELAKLREDFGQLQELELQDKINKLREDAEKKKEKDQKDRLEGEKKITDQLSSQVQNINDAVAALRLINRIQTQKSSKAKQLAREAANIANAQADAQEKGDVRRLKRLQSREDALREQGNIRGFGKDLFKVLDGDPDNQVANQDALQDFKDDQKVDFQREFKAKQDVLQDILMELREIKKCKCDMEFPEANDPDIAAFKEGEELAKEFMRQKFEDSEDTPDPTSLSIPKPEFSPPEPGIIDRNGVRGAGIQHILPSIGDITINANGLDAKEAKEFIGEELAKQIRKASGVI